MWRRLLGGFLASFSLFAQTPGDLFRAYCAGCHGPAGEGSRGPSLGASATQRANDLESLVALLRNGVPGTEMPAIAPRTLSDLQLRELAGYVLGLRANSQNGASGHLSRGAELFRGKGKCTGCHRLNGEGRASARDLSDIGRRRDPAWLRRAVLDPESAIYDSFGGYRWTIEIPDNYLLVEIATTKGERVDGSRLNEDPFSIQIRDSSGRIRSFLKQDIATLNKKWGKSPMPSYRDVFSAGEVDDIVDYLAGLRGVR